MTVNEFLKKVTELNKEYELDYTQVIVVDSEGYIFDDMEISFNQDDIPCLQIKVG